MNLNRWAAWRALLGVLFLGALAGCEETKTVAPADDPVALEVTPTGAVDLAVGDTLRLHVTVRNAPDPGVTFRSTVASVASVSSSGLITAVSAGTTTVTVASVADPSRQVSVVVRVVAVSPPAGEGRAAIAIASILEPATGQQVNRAAVAGPVLLRLDYAPGRATRLEVLAGDSVRCVTSLPAPAALGRQDCILDTAQFDSTTGAVAFANAPLTLSARLIGPADSVLAATAPATLVLQNRDRLVARLAAPRQATDAQGLLWLDGSLTVTATPVLYERGAAVARAQFTYAVPGGDPIVRSDAEAPFSVTFPETASPASGGLQGIVDPDLRVGVVSTLRGGEAGPSAVVGPLRYDNEAPAAGGLRGRSWVGAQTRFLQLYDARGESDRGVGRTSVRFFAGSPGATAAEVVAQGREVSVGSDLAAAAVGTYRLAALVCDALGNCRAVEGFTFGVDLTPPAITGTNLPDRAVNPDQSLVVSVEDDRSGFAGDFLQALVTLVDESATTAECGPRVDDLELPGKLVNGACVPDTVAALPTPQRVPGYYTYRIAPLDQAGNVGTSITRTFLVDRTPPSIAGVTLPAQLTAGRDATVRVEAADNLDLLSTSASLVYAVPQGGRLAIPFALPDSAGAPFDPQLVTRHTASLTFPFVATLTVPAAGRVSGAPTLAADSVRVRVRDVARWTADASRPVSATAPNSNPFAAVDSVDAMVSFQNVCTAGCLATDQTSTTLTVRLIGATGFRNPLEGGRVYFFSQDSTGTVALLGSTTSSSVSETGAQRVLSYSLAVRPPAGVQGDFTLFAVGVNAAGNGLRIGSAQLRLIVRR